jgi:uncharacterized protein (DUF3820 family)
MKTKGNPRFFFGKYNGRLISDIEIIDGNYVKWYKDQLKSKTYGSL